MSPLSLSYPPAITSNDSYVSIIGESAVHSPLSHCLNNRTIVPLLTNKKGNRLSVNTEGEIHLRTKTPFEVIGERVVQPIFNKAYNLFSIAKSVSGHITDAIFPVKAEASKSG